jgi:hypothetical protein
MEWPYQDIAKSREGQQTLPLRQPDNKSRLPVRNSVQKDVSSCLAMLIQECANGGD